MTSDSVSNQVKADVFFKAATEHLNLMESDKGSVLQSRPIVDDHYACSPYICDAVEDAMRRTIDCWTPMSTFTKEMRLFGMNEVGFGVWNHIPAEERQEARWFFLMLMVEYLDDVDNS